MPDQPDRPRIPLVADITARDSSLAKDARVLNGYVSKRLDGGYDLYKRPGLDIYSDQADAAGRGMYNWEGIVYWIWDGTIYEDSVAIPGSINNSGFYHFSQYKGGTPGIFFKNTSKAYTYNGAALTEVTDGDYPAETVYGAAYLDSTTYVMTPKGEIYGSALDNPQSWDALNKIVAGSEADFGVAITKHHTYIAAIKETSTEFFYNAANPTGSPLARIDQLKLPFGCPGGAAETVASIEDNLFWASQNRSGGICVVHLTRGMSLEIISSAPVERILQDSNMAGARAQTFKFAGHRFYILSLPSSALSLVYDIGEKVWYQWKGLGEEWFNARSISFVGQAVLVQHSSDGDIYKFNAATYQDADHGTFLVELVTPIWDAGTTRVKTVTLLEVVSDKYSSNLIDLSFSDNDYQSWSDNRPVILSLGISRLANLGTFSRRAYRIQHFADAPLRLQYLEHQLMLGTL